MRKLDNDDDDDTQVYKKPWVGLTDEEVDNFLKASWGRGVTPEHFIQAIEAKLKEKNA